MRFRLTYCSSVSENLPIGKINDEIYIYVKLFLYLCVLNINVKNYE